MLIKEIEKLRLEVATSIEDYNNHFELLYKNFLPYGKDHWYIKNYFTIQDNKLIPNIPKEDQRIYLLKKNDNSIVVGSSYCLNYEYYDAIKMGFQIPNEKDICYGLHFYTNFNDDNPMDLYEIYKDVSVFMFEDLKKLGYKKIYGSCDSKIYRSYKPHGFRKIDERAIENNLEYLILKNLDN
jgi:hypothetical protein